MMFNQINAMKITRILSLIALMAIGFSCSKDDEVQPDVEKAEISFSGNATVVEAPAAMLASDDEYAQLAAGWISMANGMSANLALFTPPAGATKSTELITPVNGRVAANSGVVYFWSDPQYGSVAYQIRDGADKYIFELFYKGNGETGWYRYLYAQELKDKSAGHMILYDAWGLMNDTRKEEMIRWDWSRSGDNFTFTMSEFDYGFNFTMTVNTKTKAGSITYFEGDITLYEMTWDAQGKGTWKEYDEEGALIAEGTWE